LADDGVPLVAMGDFNDSPDGIQFKHLEGRLVNKSESLFSEGKGTIRYKGKWELIDMFLTSKDLDGRSVMEIVEIPFLMVRDTRHSGMKPFRTYSGPRYIGGVSDHCPIILRVYGL
jgi:exonuclease III